MGAADGGTEDAPGPEAAEQPGGAHAATGRGTGSARTAAVWSARVLSALLAVALLVVSGWAFYTVRRLDSGLTRLHLTINQPPVAPATDSASPSASATPRDVDGKDQNILLVGNDDRSDMTDKEVGELHVGRDGGSINTDTMLIVHAPADGSSATLISLPRDSYVAIPGYGMNRLNAAYAFGYNNSGGNTNAKRAAGANLLIKTVTQLTGLTINHFVQIGLVGFYRITQAIRGVPVDLCEPIDGRPYTNLVLSAGRHTLNGVQALEFVRQRHYLTNGDFDRVARARYFITAAFREVASGGVLLNPAKLSALVSALDQSLYVDEDFDPLQFARQVATLNPNNIVGETIPFDGYETIDGAAVNAVDPAEVQHFVANLIDGTSGALAKAKPVAPRTVRVVVSYAGTSSSVDAAVTTLRKAGFRASAGASSDYATKTVIRYPKGMEGAAKTVGRYVRGAEYDRTAQGSAVTVLLAADNLTVHATPRATRPAAIDAGCIH